MIRICNQSPNRLRGRLTGRYTTRLSDPFDLLHNGRVPYNDVQQSARQGNFPNNWKRDVQNFPLGGFKYQDGSYTVHGYGINPNAVSNFLGSNLATGPTVNVRGLGNLNHRADGT